MFAVGESERRFCQVWRRRESLSNQGDLGFSQMGMKMCERKEKKLKNKKSNMGFRGVFSLGVTCDRFFQFIFMILRK